MTVSLAPDGEENLLVEVGHLLGNLQGRQRADTLPGWLGKGRSQQYNCASHRSDVD